MAKTFDPELNLLENLYKSEERDDNWTATKSGMR
jgi:hypothetical protein